MHIAPATLSRMIGRMEKYGYLERRPDGRDQRITRIYPASGARLVMEKLDCVNREMEGDLFKGFSESEKEEFLEYAKRICDNMQRAKTPIARVCLQEEKQI